MDRAPRILIVQDRADTTKYQVDTFQRVGRDYGPVEVESFNLKRDPDELVDALKTPDASGYDWIVADLLEDAIDVDPLQCAGVNLLRCLRNAGYLLGYARPSSGQRGIRCVSVYSALLGDGNAVGRRVADELEEMGVQRDWMTSVGDISHLARRIYDRLKAEGFFASSGAAQ